ncbi:MAG: hypothetical protein R2712_06240 [Vicinamibacterales bacterium]
MAEDVGAGDVTTAATIQPADRARGTMIAKAPLVVAGLDVAAEAFRQLDPAAVVEVHWGDGAHVQAGDAIATITGSARAPHGGANRAQHPAAHERHRHAHRSIS